jgi:two-component system alkaline phosphatase synthesis response regulator PhoP
MIFLLEDDESIRNFVIYTLRNTGFEAEGFEKPTEFWRAMEKRNPKLILLDIMDAPNRTDLKFSKNCAPGEKLLRLPVIMLTAKGAEYDKILVLIPDADDNVTKPFGMMELVSRIKALIRRTEDEAEKASMSWRDFM